MTKPPKIHLGCTKYDTRNRRITLLKRISEKMDMKEGDFIEFYEIDNEIIIRKANNIDYRTICEQIIKTTDEEELKKKIADLKNMISEGEQK